jgi:hypothetical protein
MANTVCRQLGFQSGATYTFGHSTALPTLPIVAGYRRCHGGERDLFNCEDFGNNKDPPLDDADCSGGCPGGTIDKSCTHSIDQGAICYDAASPSQVAIATGTCRGTGSAAAAEDAEPTDQPAIFSCIDFYSARCTYDITNGDRAYMFAMRAFAQCTDVTPEPAGYCHGALSDAAVLSNNGVCKDGATQNIGFHIRVPFRVITPGDFAFRLHADYGLGSFVGVDGSAYTPGDTYGHIAIDATALTAGEHEFDVLGFENCCDGHAELEVHLPCDTAKDPWRIVSAGLSDCMKCGSDLPETCSSALPSAACCGSSGGHTMCNIPKEGTTCEDHQFENEALNGEDISSVFGRFVAGPESMDLASAKTYCETNHRGLASIHSNGEQLSAKAACDFYVQAGIDASTDDPDHAPIGCWIGLTDEVQEGGFVWTDGSAVEFVNWKAGEPNNAGGDGTAGSGENGVNLYFTNGRWNDRGSGQPTDKLMFPLCNSEPAYSTSGGLPAPGAQMVWGTGRTSSFRFAVCVDHSDTLFFQDDRLWMVYGGQWAPPGAHGQCSDAHPGIAHPHAGAYHGKAYVNNQEWDISSLSACKPGIGCAVSSTFTDRQFEVPMGCGRVDMQVTQNSGRGAAPQTVAPSATNGFRGEVRLSDEGFGGTDVYDITVTLTCTGVGTNSAPTVPVRLSCTHDFGAETAGTGTGCHMGRIEVFNPNAEHAGRTAPSIFGGTHSAGSAAVTAAGAWGSVCGYVYWDNDNLSDMVCKQLGFASGQTYTFGTTHLLPTLPIVAGYRLCQGTENSVFDCQANGLETSTWTGRAEDMDCGMTGCMGQDGEFGTTDDSVSPACTHNLDQGAICMYADSQQSVKPERMCAAQNAMGGNSGPVTFGCVDFYTTQCSYDITHNDIAGGMGSYMTAMRAFAACAAAQPEPAGYCHGSLKDASMLSNNGNCAGAMVMNRADDPTTPDTDESTQTYPIENIGFHIRIPFEVRTEGMYTFRYHVDMGLGMFMGVDGPEYRPGSAWGHLQADGAVLAMGEHEWEVLGFEDCCDGHAELEVHLPCDKATSPWRLVAAAQGLGMVDGEEASACLSCDATIEETHAAVCSAQTTPAACCQHEGQGYAGGSQWNEASGAHPALVCSACDDPNKAPTASHVGRFVVVGKTMTMMNAIDYCEEHYASLASVHSWEEQQQAAAACQAYEDEAMVANADGSDGNTKYGCWIGFQDLGAEGGFAWLDGSSVQFVDWAAGEPNDVNGGEDAVEMDFRSGLQRCVNMTPPPPPRLQL